LLTKRKHKASTSQGKYPKKKEGEKKKEIPPTKKEGVAELVSKREEVSHKKGGSKV